MEKIVILQLQGLQKRIKEREISLEWSSELVKHLAEEGYDPFFGARPLKRLIQQEVVNLLSNALLEGKIPSNSKILLNFKDGSYSFQEVSDRSYATSSI